MLGKGMSAQSSSTCITPHLQLLHLLHGCDASRNRACADRYEHKGIKRIRVSEPSLAAVAAR